MKTYSLKKYQDYFELSIEYKGQRPYSEWITPRTESGDYAIWGGDMNRCKCIYYFLVDPGDHAPNAYEDCSNCGGKGIEPIPWEELG